MTVSRSMMQRASLVSSSNKMLFSLVSLWVTRKGSSPLFKRSVRAEVSASRANAKSISALASEALPIISFSIAFCRSLKREGVLWKLGIVSWRVLAG